MPKPFPITRIDLLEFAAIICLYALVSALADEARYARTRALEDLRADLAAASDAPEPAAAEAGALSEP